MRTLATVFILLPFLFVAGCDSDDDDETGSNARVVDLNVSDDSISVGEGTVVEVDFTFSADDVFDDGENIVVVVRLSPELAYREGTAEIQSVGDDESVGPQITRCSSGESYLVFDMDDFDLEDAQNPDGDADARLTLTVDGTEGSTIARLEAAADNNSVFFGCTSGFFPDAVESVSVIN